MKLIKLLLLILLFLIPVGQLGRIPFLLENTFIYPNDILIPILVAIWLVYRLSVKKTFYVPELTKPILLVLAVSALSLLVARAELTTQQFIVSSFYLARLIEYLALYFVIWDVVRQDGNRVFWMRALLLTVLLVVIGGFAQYILVPDFSFAVEYGWDPHVGRLLGTFFDPNFIAGFLSLALALTLSLLTSRQPNYRIALSILAAALFVAIILTFSRSGYLALAAVIGVIGLLRSRWLLMVSIVGFAVAVLMIPRIQERLTEGFEQGQSASFRITSWTNALAVWETSPIIGVGYNAYRYSQDRLGLVNLEKSGNAGAGADSSMLFILATTGVVGGLAWLYLLWRIIGVAWRDLPRGDLGLALLASLCALAIHSQFVNSFFFIWIMLWFWLLVGLTQAEVDSRD